MNKPLLSVTGLQSGYKGSRVLHGMTLALGASEVVAIIGRNGVGKTTFMRTLMGVLPTDAGTIQLAGREISKLAPEDRARAGIGYVPQGRDIFPGLSVEENMKVGLQVLRKRSGQEMEHALDFFPVLRKKLGQKAGTMSGGEQQQLAIARVLIAKPKVLLLDEPSEGIQPSIVTMIAEQLAYIAKSMGLGVLLVEQNMNMIERAADRCCIMEKGRVVGEMGVDQLHDESKMREHLAA